MEFSLEVKGSLLEQETWMKKEETTQQTKWRQREEGGSLLYVTNEIQENEDDKVVVHGSLSKIQEKKRKVVKTYWC